jgi:hypothetical protein
MGIGFRCKAKQKWQLQSQIANTTVSLFSLYKTAGGWHKGAVQGKTTQLKIKRVPTKASINRNREKVAPKKAAPKKAVIKGDPIESILAKMSEMDQVGFTGVKEQEVLSASGYSSRDSKGFRKIAKELIQELGYVTKNTKNKVTIYTLTERGRNHLLETGVIVVAAEPKTNQEHHDKLQEKLEKIVVAPKIKLEAVFKALRGGDWHSIPDLLSAADYGSPDSKGYRSIMFGMRKLDLLEKKGKNIRFNDKAFKFGRPEN